jgi:DNA invertase Pin-like site-specific DNA recombinase
MLAVFAAFETDVRREWQMEDIALAKRQGIYTGGRARLDRARVKQLGRGHRAGERARAGDMARSSVYRLIIGVGNVTKFQPRSDKAHACFQQGVDPTFGRQRLRIDLAHVYDA